MINREKLSKIEKLLVTTTLIGTTSMLLTDNPIYDAIAIGIATLSTGGLLYLTPRRLLGLGKENSQSYSTKIKLKSK